VCPNNRVTYDSEIEEVIEEEILEPTTEGDDLLDLPCLSSILSDSEGDLEGMFLPIPQTDCDEPKVEQIPLEDPILVDDDVVETHIVDSTPEQFPLSIDTEPIDFVMPHQPTPPSSHVVALFREIALHLKTDQAKGIIIALHSSMFLQHSDSRTNPFEQWENDVCLTRVKFHDLRSIRWIFKPGVECPRKVRLNTLSKTRLIFQPKLSVRLIDDFVWDPGIFSH